MAAVSKADYLKRYASKDERLKGDKKKKKPTSTRESKLKIIDDDLDLKKLKSRNQALENEFNDEAPTVAEFIDERPKHVRQLEEYRKNSRWKLLGKNEEDETSALDYGVIPQNRKGQQGSHSGSDSVPSKRRHDTSDSDSSPHRTNSKSGTYVNTDRKSQRHDSDSDTSHTHSDKNSKVDRKKDTSLDNSPPRKKQQKISKRHDSDSDASPPRKSQGRSQNSKSSSSLSQKSSTSHRKNGAGSDSDNSSQRRSRKHVSDSDSEQSPPRKHKREISGSDLNRQRKFASDQSPPRRKNKPGNSDSDQSPPRKSASNFDQSRVRKKKLSGSDSDQSPPRKSANLDQSPPGRKIKPVNSNSDQSPPRKSTKSNQSPSRKRTKPAASDSDQSPPRKSAAGFDSDQSPPRRRQDSDSSDQSPPRKKQTASNSQYSRFNDDHQDDRQAKATKTLGGAKAGLSSAKEMREEAKKLREKEDRSFQSIGDDKLGKNAKTVVRDKETGKKRDLRAEEAKNAEDEKRKEEQLKKYQQWGKGLKQQEMRDSRLLDQVHEASKPLARFKDDKDLDEMLRQEERLEDPMLDFIRKKKEKEDKKTGKKKKNELPKYKGPLPPPNRFNIQPGYRWDGVDRSNGFEKKIFASQANKKAIQEIAYKWSTEDM